MDEIDNTISKISRDSLDCMAKVATTATTDLESMPIDIRKSLASFNNFTGTETVNAYASTQTERMRALDGLTKEPVVARVEYLDDKDRRQIVYITRTQTPSTTSPFKVASYRSALGRLASIQSGDSISFVRGNDEFEFRIISNAQLRPAKTDADDWDSLESVVDVEDFGIYTVKSFKFFTSVRETEEIVDISSAWEDEASEADKGYIDGIRHAIRTHMSLRDQAVLDAQQDEVFRRPLNSRLFLSGPPGSGKTTTLIRRLGQKTDVVVMQESPEEFKDISNVESDTDKQHSTNWVMFSPSDLLRQYVKEAFARERLPATDKHIRVWADYRRDIARDTLRLLRTGERRGSFTLREASVTLTNEALYSSSWFDDFRRYMLSSITESISATVEQMSSSDHVEIRDLGDRLYNLARELDGATMDDMVDSLIPVVASISALAKRKNDEIVELITIVENRAVRDNSKFPDLLVQKIGEIRSTRTGSEIEDAEELDIDDEDDEEPEEPATAAVSRKFAQRTYQRALRAMAKARANGRTLAKASANAHLVEWLGPAQRPSDRELASLAQLTQERAWLLRFSNVERLFLRGIPRLYKQFRRERADERKWYTAAPEKSESITSRELDVVILAMFKAADSIMSAYARRPAVERQLGDIVGAIRRLRFAQVLVDEATDFSAIELACMYALCHPALKSFFLCGDLNQRLTETGIRDAAALEWVCPGIDRQTISISYRQSRKLVDLARAIASLDGSEPDEIALPRGHRNEGVAPVWREQLPNDKDVAAWLTERIGEIERMIKSAPTIAVMVDSEDRVEKLTKALNQHLEEVNLTAQACRGGQVLGNDRSVRVFDIKHIKGLEFEAAFFVGLDEIVNRLPELYSKYLYVGATRAATYVGITFDNKRPAVLTPLAPHFAADWATIDK